MAAFALGLDRQPAGGADALTTALASPDPLLQGRAAEALGVLGHKAAAPAIAAMMTPACHGRRRSPRSRPDDVGYPKDATVEAVRLGLYALVRLAAYDELAATLLDDVGCACAAAGGRWPSRSSGSATPAPRRCSRRCFRARDRSPARSPRAGWGR